MAFFISRRSLRSSASRLRTMVMRIRGSAADARMSRMVQAMINSRSVMPAWRERIRRGNRLDFKIAFIALPRFQRCGRIAANRQEWLRGLDSNQDSQLQRLVSYQLDDPG